jgi:hypothetical protein
MTAPTIERYRGDTFANVFAIKDANGDPIDITDYTFKLTVNANRTPEGTATQLFQLTGVLVSPSQGTVKFAPTSEQANQPPGTYFYDIQMTDNDGAVQTLTVGKYVFKQDITKT